MSALRDIWTDLVDKRLWPLAVAMVLALVAVPALLLEPAPATKPPAPTVSADAGPAALVTDPAAVAPPRPGGPVAGEVKDPFRQRHLPKAPDAGSSTASAGPGTTGSGATPGSTGQGGGTGGPPAVSPSAPGGGGGSAPAPRRRAPSGDELSGTFLKVRFGRSGTKRSVRLLAAGMPLPGAANPMLVFVDVGKDGRAEFVVSSDARAEGEGRCEPSRTVCAQLFLKRGQTSFFDVTRASGTVQYQLDVVDVVRR